MVRIGHFVAITVLLLNSVLAYAQIQQDVDGLKVRKPDEKNDILSQGTGREDVDSDLEKRSPFIQALVLRGISLAIRGIKKLKSCIRKKKRKKKARNAARASSGANHVNNNHRRMLEEDEDEFDGTESESIEKHSDDGLYEHGVDAYIERYLDKKLRTFVVSILKNLTEEELDDLYEKIVDR